LFACCDSILPHLVPCRGELDAAKELIKTLPEEWRKVLHAHEVDVTRLACLTSKCSGEKGWRCTEAGWWLHNSSSHSSSASRTALLLHQHREPLSEASGVPCLSPRPCPTTYAHSHGRVQASAPAVWRALLATQWPPRCGDVAAAAAAAAASAAAAGGAAAGATSTRGAAGGAARGAAAAAAAAGAAA